MWFAFQKINAAMDQKPLWLNPVALGRYMQHPKHQRIGGTKNPLGPLRLQCIQTWRVARTVNSDHQLALRAEGASLTCLDACLTPLLKVSCFLELTQASSCKQSQPETAIDCHRLLWHMAFWELRTLFIQENSAVFCFDGPSSQCLFLLPREKTCFLVLDKLYTVLATAKNASAPTLQSPTLVRDHVSVAICRASTWWRCCWWACHDSIWWYDMCVTTLQASSDSL